MLNGIFFIPSDVCGWWLADMALYQRIPFEIT
jgi:hypothetical protein